MYSVTPRYSALATDPFRSENVYMSLGFNIDNTAADDLEGMTGNTLPMSDPSVLTNADYNELINFATFEEYGIPTAPDAGSVVPPITSASNLETGMWSDVISDDAGNITWSMTMTLSEPHTSAFTAYTSGPSITSATATFILNGVETAVTMDCSERLVSVENAYTYDSIRIDVQQIDVPFAHVRFVEVEFGNSITLGVDQLANSVVYIDEIDPLQIGLPMKELDFDLVNVKGEYDEDNPNSLYGRMAIGNPINLAYTLSNGTDRVTIPMGRFVIGEKLAKNNLLSVVAYDVRWKLLQSFNVWSISQSEDLGTTLSNLLTSLDLSSSVDPSVNAIYPLADHTFNTDTTVLSDIQMVSQAYGLTFIPDRGGVIQIGSAFDSDVFGELPRGCQLSTLESSQMNRYNYMDISYGPGLLQHYTRDLRSSVNTARSVLSINNELVINQAQAEQVCNRIVSRIYTKAAKVKWISDPAMDLYDQVQVCTQWTVDDPSTYRGIKREITFDGMLTEETTFVL